MERRRRLVCGVALVPIDALTLSESIRSKRVVGVLVVGDFDTAGVLCVV